VLTCVSVCVLVCFSLCVVIIVFFWLWYLPIQLFSCKCLVNLLVTCYSWAIFHGHRLAYLRGNCFECCRIARFLNDVYMDCIYYTMEEKCDSTAADFYVNTVIISIRWRLAAVNCTISNNHFTYCLWTARRLSVGHSVPWLHLTQNSLQLSVFRLDAFFCTWAARGLVISDPDTGLRVACNAGNLQISNGSQDIFVYWKPILAWS